MPASTSAAKKPERKLADTDKVIIVTNEFLATQGDDFGPGEQVTVYLNNPDAPPLTTIQTDDTGAFTNAGGFLVPFGLKGKQTLIFMGKDSKAPTTASFDTLPYTPSAQPSTYGGRPGTTLTFQAVVSKSTPTDLRAETLTVAKVTRDMR